MKIFKSIKGYVLRYITRLLVRGPTKFISDFIAMPILFFFEITQKKNPIKTLPRKQELVAFLDDLVEKVMHNHSRQGNQSDLTRIEQFFQPNKSQLLFLDYHVEGSLTSSVITNLFESAKRHSGITASYLNLSDIPVNERSKTLQSCFNDLDGKYFVFFEIHVGIGESEATLNPKMFSQINNFFDVKLVPISFDLYRNFDKVFVDFWSPQSGAIIHLDPLSAKKLEANIKMIFWPFVFIPQSIDNGFQIDSHQNYLRKTIIFQGSINSASRVRHLFLLFTLSNRLAFKVRLVQSNMKKLQSDIKRQNLYYQDLSNALAVINFNEKQNSTHSVITFRAIETLSLGGCLLEQQNAQLASQLTNLAVPYKHYLPFESPKELILLCWALNRNPEIAEHIKANARKHWEDHYSEIKLWSQLMDLLECL